MVTAAITITLREEFGLTGVSLRHPNTEFRYLAGIEEPDRGLGLVEVSDPNVESILGEIEAVDEVQAFELLDRDGNRAVFQYEIDVATLYRIVREADIIPEFPYAIRNGTILFTVTTTTNRLSRLGDTLRSLGIPFDVTSVSGTFGRTDRLTDRQRRFVVTAVEKGYYETPRRCTLADIADDFGVASSTASETLRRAEGHIVERFVADLTPEPNLGE